jgi:hypothetical protein
MIPAIKACWCNRQTVGGAVAPGMTDETAAVTIRGIERAEKIE